MKQMALFISQEKTRCKGALSLETAENSQSSDATRKIEKWPGMKNLTCEYWQIDFSSNKCQRSMSTSLLLWLLSTLFFLVAFCVLGKIRKLIQVDNTCQNDDSLITFRPIWKRISGKKWEKLATRKFIAGRYGLSGLISTRVNDDSKVLRRQGFRTSCQY